MMRVRASRRGYYGNLLRRPGDVFTLARAEDFSPRWMTAVSSETPEHRTSVEHPRRVGQDRVRPLGATRRVCEPVDPNEDRPVDWDFDPFA
jgi:hypothetical protein